MASATYKRLETISGRDIARHLQQTIENRQLDPRPPPEAGAAQRIMAPPSLPVRARCRGQRRRGSEQPSRRPQERCYPA